MSKNVYKILSPGLSGNMIHVLISSKEVCKIRQCDQKNFKNNCNLNLKTHRMFFPYFFETTGPNLCYIYQKSVVLTIALKYLIY